MPYIDAVQLNANPSNESTEIFQAVVSGDLVRFMTAFTEGDCNQVDVLGRTAFSYAAEKGLLGFLIWMCESSEIFPSIDAQGQTVDKSIADHKGKTAIYYARKQRHLFGKNDPRNRWYIIVDKCRIPGDDDWSDDEAEEHFDDDDYSVGDIGGSERRELDAQEAQILQPNGGQSASDIESN